MSLLEKKQFLERRRMPRVAQLPVLVAMKYIEHLRHNIFREQAKCHPLREGTSSTGPALWKVRKLCFVRVSICLPGEEKKPFARCVFRQFPFLGNSHFPCISSRVFARGADRGCAGVGRGGPRWHRPHLGQLSSLLQLRHFCDREAQGLFVRGDIT